MKIYTTAKLTRSQDTLLDDFQNISIVPAGNCGDIIATIKTYTEQKIKLTINEGGIITSVKLVERYG